MFTLRLCPLPPLRDTNEREAAALASALPPAQARSPLMLNINVFEVRPIPPCNAVNPNSNFYFITSTHYVAQYLYVSSYIFTLSFQASKIDL